MLQAKGESTRSLCTPDAADPLSSVTGFVRVRDVKQQKVVSESLKVVVSNESSFVEGKLCIGK